MNDPMHGDHILLITPFDEQGNLDSDSLANHIEFVLAGGAHGVVGLGTTGEFFTLEASERILVMETISTHVCGRVPLTFGVGDSSTRVSIALARKAQEFGASCVMLQPPYYFGHSGAAIREHMLMVARMIDIPVMIYDGAGGIELSVETLRQLHAQAPNINYVKLSLPKPSKVAEVVAHAPGVQVFCGDDNMLVLALGYGAVGSTIGSGNLQPAVTSGIFNAYSDRDIARARQLHSEKLVPAVSICGTSKSEYIRCFKEVLFAKGIIRTPVTRPPLLPLNPLRQEELLAVMQNLGVL